MNRIQTILNEKGITQTWLAKKLGKSVKIVNTYANNRSQPSLSVLFRIADILKVEARDLLSVRTSKIKNNEKLTNQ